MYLKNGKVGVSGQLNDYIKHLNNKDARIRKTHVTVAATNQSSTIPEDSATEKYKIIRSNQESQVYKKMLQGNRYSHMQNEILCQRSKQLEQKFKE